MKITPGSIGLVGALIAFEIASQFFLQKAIKIKQKWYKNHFLLLGVFGQVLMALIYFAVLRSGFSLAIANTLIDGGGSLGIVLLGYYVFKQKLNPMQLLSVFITMVGVIMLGIFDY